MPEWAIAIVSLIIGFVMNFIFENYRETKKIRKEGLKNHFSRLAENILQPASNTFKRVHNNLGRLVFGSGTDSELQRRIEMRRNDDFSIFCMHFPKEAQEVIGIMNGIKKHNKNIDNLLDHITNEVKSTTNLPILTDGKPPLMYKHTVHHLYSILYRREEMELSDNNNTIIDSFSEAKIYKENAYWRVGTGANANPTIYADLPTEEEAKQCKQNLISLQNNASLLSKVQDILIKARQLNQDADDFAKLLDFIYVQYSQLQKVLKKHKECPYCQVIFSTR